MAILQIVKYPQGILRKRAEEVLEITDDVKELIVQMIDSMYEHEGIGLAAPQINISKRIIIVETSHEPRENQILPAGRQGKPLAFLNPIITIHGGKKLTEEEGCLSLPGLFVPVKRSERVQVTCQNSEGKDITIQASGLLARIFQHEVDHLNGKLIIHRTSPLTRLKIWKRLGAFEKQK